MIVILLIVTVLLMVISWFLAKEMKRKFHFLGKWSSSSPNMHEWQYDGCLSLWHQPGMRTVVLKADQPFGVLLGVKLNFPLIGLVGFDPYGYIDSTPEGVVVISTYLGKGKATFQFITTQDVKMSISSSDSDQSATIMASYPPHWFQRLF